MNTKPDRQSELERVEADALKLPIADRERLLKILLASLDGPFENDDPGRSFASDGLGKEIVDAVDAMVREIGKWPMAGRSFDPSIRGRTLGRFPCWVLYQQRGSIIWVVSLVHQNRGEDFWRSRWGVRDESAAYVPRAV